MKPLFNAPLAAVLACSSVLAAYPAYAKRGELKRPPKVNDIDGPASPGGGEAHFLGAHPIAAKLGGGYCYIDVPHMHSYAPDRPALFQQVGQEYVFTGDPVPFGYEGDKTVFYGPHPVPIRVALPFAPKPVYCSIRGPHYHDYAAPPVPDYRVQNNVVFYIGPLDPAYERVRPQAERAAEEEYRPFVAMRPQVMVAPPPEWHGEVWTAPQPPSVQITAPQPPSISITAPQPPSVQIMAPQPPSISITAPQPPSVHFVAPQPPGVFVVAPAPPSVQIVGPGAPSMFIGPRPVYIETHDRGRHRGWYREHEEHGHEWHGHEGRGHGHGHH